MEKRIKTYVLDTNVLIHDPESMFRFQDNVVVIPYPVLEELDSLKKSPNGKAYSARKVIRYVDNLIDSGSPERKTYGYDIQLPNNGKLVITDKWLSENDTTDNIILKYCYNISTSLNNYFPSPTILVTKDASFRIKAMLRGFSVQDYKTDKTRSFERYGKITSTPEKILSVQYCKDENIIYKIKNQEKNRINTKTVLNIIPKTLCQTCALDALLDVNIDLVVLNGYAGTGKTLLALAAGISQVLKGDFEQVIVMRPVIPMQGTDIGYLPGDVKEKLNPWMQPIYDNLTLIASLFELTSHSVKKNKKKTVSNLDDIVQIQALTFIRGRSLPNSFIIIDESQNLRPIDIKTIVTRAGEKSKVVFTGDLEQIDTPYLDASSSGLAYLVDRFINELNFCYLNLQETVRSKLAEQGARLL